MKGCSSLGFLRFAALVWIEVPEGQRRLALVDLKEAVEAAAPVAPGAAMPSDLAERVVAGARTLSPNLGKRMLPVWLRGKSVVMRELAPQDLKLDVDQFGREEAVRAAHYLAYVVGMAHGRQMDEAARSAWRSEIMRGMGAGEEASSWLWSSVVELAGRHEVGYLQHCRLYADRQAA